MRFGSTPGRQVSSRAPRYRSFYQTHDGCCPTCRAIANVSWPCHKLHRPMRLALPWGEVSRGRRRPLASTASHSIMATTLPESRPTSTTPEHDGRCRAVADIGTLACRNLCRLQPERVCPPDRCPEARSPVRHSPVIGSSQRAERLAPSRLPKRLQPLLEPSGGAPLCVLGHPLSMKGRHRLSSVFTLRSRARETRVGVDGCRRLCRSRIAMPGHVNGSGRTAMTIARTGRTVSQADCRDFTN